MVAKDGRTWIGPAFYDLATASVGFQAGIEISEAVILVMTDKAFNSLQSSSFKIGGDASIAAGPVGAGAKADVTADLIPLGFPVQKAFYAAGDYFEPTAATGVASEQRPSTVAIARKNDILSSGYR